MVGTAKFEVQCLRERLRPSTSMDSPNKVQAAAVPRADVEAPTSHLQPGLARSARARLENEDRARIVESVKMDLRMRRVDTKTEDVSRAKHEHEQHEHDRNGSADHKQSPDVPCGLCWYLRECMPRRHRRIGGVRRERRIRWLRGMGHRVKQ